MSSRTPAGSPQLPEPGSMRCPRCSATLGPEQDWCLECGAPARTRLAPTPNWQVPTFAVVAIVALAGALLAFSFVKLTSDDGGAPAGTTPTAVVEAPPPAAVAPPAGTTLPAATTTLPAGAAAPSSTVPGQTTPAAGTATPGTTTLGATTPATGTTTPGTATTPTGTPTTGTTPASPAKTTP